MMGSINAHRILPNFMFKKNPAKFNYSLLQSQFIYELENVKAKLQKKGHICNFFFKM